jgi:hypothetical protein
VSVLIPPALQVHANAQFGLVTRAQSLESLTRSGLQRRLVAGVLGQVDWGVYRLVGAPISWRQRALASCLALGQPVAVSHLAAAYLWQVPCVAAPRIQLTLPPERRSARVYPVHRRLLPPADVTTRWAIPVTTPVRTVIDLSTSVAKPLLERVIDDLVRSQHLRIEEVAERMASPELRPRFRSEMVGEIVAVRLARGIGASPREDWLVDSLLAAGLALPERNLIVEAGGGLYELDAAYPELKIGIEYDGWQVHGSHQHFHADRDKLAVLQLEGWIVLSVTSIWTAEVLVARVKVAIGQRQREGVALGTW